VVGAVDLVVLVVALATGVPAVRMAPDKHGPIIARAARPGGLDIPFSRWSRFGRVDVTEPFATLPPQFGGDVSPIFMQKIEQRMLMLDGAAPAFLYRVARSPAELEFLAATSQSPVYRLRPSPAVLVIGVGGATDVLIALSQGARKVVGVEVNPVTIEATRDVFGPYVGDVLRDPRVTVVVAEGRNFAARDRERYDIVQLSGVDTGAAQGAYGLGTMPESYVYTTEALRDLLARLAPGGVLSITRDSTFGWGLRLVNVARAALAAEGLDAGPRVAVLKGTVYGWATVLVKREPFTSAEAEALRDFADRYHFPLLYDPLGAGDPEFVQVVRDASSQHAEFDLRPPTDDWPFFFMSFRWGSLPRVFAPDAPPLLKPIAFLIANLTALALLAALLIGWPLWRLRDAWREARGKAVAAGYFAALGAGFILVEIALMQRFTVYLGDPTLAVATVLAALLVSSGVGSLATRHVRSHPATVYLAVACILLALLFFASPLSHALLHETLAAPLGARLALAVLLVAAAGIPLGMPFPAGLARVAARSGPFVPWAWGINGMLSVVSSLASYLVGMAAGYTAMFYAAAALYAGALALSRRL
jgi:spermidine synthase